MPPNLVPDRKLQTLYYRQVGVFLKVEEFFGLVQEALAPITHSRYIILKYKKNNDNYDFAESKL